MTTLYVAINEDLIDNLNLIDEVLGEVQTDVVFSDTRYGKFYLYVEVEACNEELIQLKQFLNYKTRCSLTEPDELVLYFPLDDKQEAIAALKGYLGDVKHVLIPSTEGDELKVYIKVEEKYHEFLLDTQEEFCDLTTCDDPEVQLWVDNLFGDVPTVDVVAEVVTEPDLKLYFEIQSKDEAIDLINNYFIEKEYLDVDAKFFVGDDLMVHLFNLPEEFKSDLIAIEEAFDLELQ